VLVALVGLAAQLVDGSLGMAYGVTSTTLLVALSISPAVASATVHLAEMGTTLASGVSHWRFGNVNWRVVGRLGIPGALGAFLGATALSQVSTEWAEPWTASLLFVLGVVVLTRFTLNRRVAYVPGGTPRARKLAPLGIVAGFVDASGGGGWGPIATPTLLTASRMEPRQVVGSVSAAEFLVAAAASAGFAVGLSDEPISLALVAALLAGGVVAAPLAAWLVRVAPVRVLGVTAGSLVILTNTRTLGLAFGLPAWAWGVVYTLLVVACGLALTRVIRSLRHGPAEQPGAATTATRPQTGQDARTPLS
jgi:uncharacterized membrane protein YfcA